MIKKRHDVEIKVPFVKYHWYKEINKEETNIEFIQKQIDSFKMLVDNQNKINVSDFKDEIKAFISIIPTQGHLIKLSDEYQKKNFEITNYMKKQYSHSVKIIPL
ncbi:MAG: hypothetical protein KJI71_00050 [Patescibacteria group bacterium]|nr:hypothetical protein [Patescibacteria group bacterium]